MSRSTRPSPFGKRTEKSSTRLAQFTKEELRKLWSGLGYQTEAEFLAELIELRVHGVDHVASVHMERLRRIAGIGEK